MRKLAQFLTFDWQRFVEGKTLLTIGSSDWVDFTTKNLLGTRVELVISQDKTKYDLNEGEQVSNIFEKFIVKIPEQITVPLNKHVILHGVIAKPYGDFQQHLSVSAEKIEVVKD